MFRTSRSSMQFHSPAADFRKPLLLRSSSIDLQLNPNYPSILNFRGLCPSPKLTPDASRRSRTQAKAIRLAVDEPIASERGLEEPGDSLNF